MPFVARPVTSVVKPQLSEIWDGSVDFLMGSGAAACGSKRPASGFVHKCWLCGSRNHGAGENKCQVSDEGAPGCAKGGTNVAPLAYRERRVGEKGEGNGAAAP